MAGRWVHEQGPEWGQGAAGTALPTLRMPRAEWSMGQGVTLWGARKAAPRLPWAVFGHAAWLPTPVWWHLSQLSPCCPRTQFPAGRVLAPDNEVASPMAGLKALLQALANLFSLRLGAKWKALAIRDPLQLGVPTQAGRLSVCLVQSRDAPMRGDQGQGAQKQLFPAVPHPSPAECVLLKLCRLFWIYCPRRKHSWSGWRLTTFSAEYWAGRWSISQNGTNFSEAASEGKNAERAVEGGSEQGKPTVFSVIPGHLGPDTASLRK